MLRLVDGPCEGYYLCKRAPIYLRAVLDKDGEKDVLDLEDDTPRESETVHVYKLTGSPGMVHIRGMDVHGFYSFGDYRYVPGVDGEVLRDNGAWRNWVMLQIARGKL